MELVLVQFGCYNNNIPAYTADMDGRVCGPLVQFGC